MIISVRATDVPKLILLAFWAKNRSKMTKWGDRVFGDHFLAKYHQFYEKLTIFLKFSRTYARDLILVPLDAQYTTFIEKKHF